MNRIILTVSAAVITLSSFGGIRATQPDNYGGKADAWQIRRHQEKLSVVTNGGAQVVFVGDSITHNWEGPGKAQLEKYFSAGDRRMLDLGFGADRTEHVIWRLTEGGELDGYRAKCVLLMIGTNNSGHFPFDQEPPSDTILGIRRILDIIREKQPEALVVLTAIFPRGRDMNDACRQRNEIVNKEIMKFADGKRVFWCDFNDQYLTPDGLLSPEIFPDRLHPSGIGYEIWYAAVKPYVDYALSDGKLPEPTNRYAPFVRSENYRIDQARTVYPATRIRSEGYGAKDWWLDRLEAKRNQIADSKGEIDLVFFGDSITHNWDADDRAGAPGGACYRELQKSYSILNIGYSGDQTQHLLWRGLNGELDGYRAKTVMLMIGTNNAGDSAEDVARGIQAILELIAKKQPQAKTLLLPIFPRGASAEDKLRVKNEKTNAIIKGYADGEKVIWVDFNAKFLDAKGDTAWIMPDRLHPNADGYRNIWLPSVLPYFQKIVGK